MYLVKRVIPKKERKDAHFYLKQDRTENMK